MIYYFDNNRPPIIREQKNLVEIPDHLPESPKSDDIYQWTVSGANSSVVSALSGKSQININIEGKNYSLIFPEFK
jgi:hypothetical protein